MDTRAVACGLAALLALAGAPAPRAAEPRAPSSAEVTRVLGRVRAWLEAERERLHASPKSIDRDLLVEESATRIEAGESEAAIEAWLREEIPKRRWRFAPLDPDVPPDHRYGLPFDRRVHWIVSQGNSSSPTHRGYDEFALDFAMPEGTEVWAAREGTVARVVDGFRDCGSSADGSEGSNEVIVLHDDGSFASYVRLRPGIRVAEGDSVARGALLGTSGCAADGATPHLHFQVSARRAATRIHSLPILFGDGAEGYVPKPWSLYRNRPPATARLRVSVAGTQLPDDRAFPIADPGPLQLRVDVATTTTGPLRDVTRDPSTRYVALTPWSLEVDAAGRVVFGVRSKALAPLPDDVERGFAIVTILHRETDGREGFFDAWLTLPASAPAKRERR
jgi:murein DD-endopeptidase MepM/ murein hydrolase activator NlpD